MMLDRSVLRAPLLDHRGLDLVGVRNVNYVLQQSFRYEYDAPVESLRQRLVIVPPARHGNQYRRAHLLEVNGARSGGGLAGTRTATSWPGCIPIASRRRSSSGSPP